MQPYRPPLRDLCASLELVGLGRLRALPAFAHVDGDTVTSLLEEFGRLATQVVSPTNEVGDRTGLRVDLATSTITTPPGFREAYRAYVDGGWGAIDADPAFGGGGFPHTVALAVAEMLQSANMSLALCPMLSQAAVEALSHWGSEEQQARYLAKLVSGEWTGTMQLTEPDAGSDVGALRTKAVQAPDGTWRITGQKIYITWGEHDLTDNTIHIVLARVEGSPAGTKGISCFIVPKYLVADDGSIGTRNDVRVVSTEHKMGIHASPTCVIAFGDDGEGAIGEMIGEPNTGMRTMFTMMNNARLAVGQQGVAIGEMAYQIAVDYALQRVQGRVVADGEPETIVGHADVRRMLLTMRAQLEAARHLVYLNAVAIDESRHAVDAEVRTKAQERADLLTPLSKAWCTDIGVELTSLAVQVLGGMGYTEDLGAAQLYRDARIIPIYEGTNGIQSLDLMGRKLPMRDGGVLADLVAEMRATTRELDGPQLVEIRDDLTRGIDALERTARWMLSQGRTVALDGMAGATPFLRLTATVVGGWLMARQAIAAVAAGTDDPYNAAKVTTARFFVEQLLPVAEGLVPMITATAAPLYAIAAADLASR